MVGDTTAVVADRTGSLLDMRSRMALLLVHCFQPLAPAGSKATGPTTTDRPHKGSWRSARAAIRNVEPDG
jgi:hypothetical protein